MSEAETLVRRGMAHHQRGDHAAAVADFSAALALQPDFPEALNNRGVVRQAQGDHAGAVTDLDEALRLRPAYAEAYNNRGNARQALEDLSGALADFDLALRLKPGYPQAHNNRGVARQAQRDLSGALADYDAALQLEPNYVDALHNRAGVHYLLWHHTQAIADYDRVLAFHQLRGTVDAALLCRLHLQRGDASYHSGNPDGLLADYCQAFQHDADLGPRLVVERIARDIQANFRMVLADCFKHLRSNPADYIAHARRTVVYLLIGQDDEAGKALERFHKHHPPVTLGMIHMLMAKARQHCQEHGVVVPGETAGVRLGCGS